MLLIIIFGAFLRISLGAHERIIGGQLASVGEFPHQISLHYRGKHTCGGSILHASYILTAAHCVASRANPEDFAVVSGMNQLSKGQWHDVQSITYHENFSKDDLHHDIAIIKLQKAMVFNLFQKAIALPKEDITTDIICTISGWGLTSFPGNVSEYLQKLELSTYSNSKCKKWHDVWVKKLIEEGRGKAVGTIYEGVFCAMSNINIGTCKGDSGGALVIYDLSGPVQVGIDSWVWEYCAKGLPEVFTRVFYYLDWIHNKTNNVLK